MTIYSRSNTNVTPKLYADDLKLYTLVCRVRVRVWTFSKILIGLVMGQHMAAVCFYKCCIMRV